MNCEIDSRMALPPPNLSDMGPRDTGCRPIHQSEALTLLCLLVRLLVTLESNYTVCKDLSDYLRSLFLIIKFAVGSSHFHIKLIAYCVVMRDLPRVFSEIINAYLLVLINGYNLTVYD